MALLSSDRTKKTGSAIALACALMGAALAHAAELEFSARVDRNQISIDESVSLKFSVQSNAGRGASVGQPKFNAPDFDVVNQYQSTYMETYYDGTTGNFGMRNNQQITQVLKPNKTGTLKISGLSISANGKTYTAPDVVVQVAGSGAGTPPPRGYGGGGIGLRGASKRATGPQVKVRAEVDKTQAYKGEQVIVSYYLYRRVRVFNLSVDKFPVLTGFLREDLEMPVLQARLESERVMLDGVPYERSLLMRYAAYPLQDGKLQIDGTTIKYAYYPANHSQDDEDPFMGFFRQMQPQQGSDRSEQLPIQVMALPEDGKPSSFTGGVGDFNIASAVDKYDVRANEAVTLTVKVEGRGNLAAIGEPKSQWPADVEQYDTKKTVRASPTGVGQKTFEFLLIPRAPGTLVLPGIEMSFFDPAQKAYVVRKTEPITINVGQPAPGSAPYNPVKATPPVSGAPAPGPAAGDTELRGLKPPTLSDPGVSRMPAWRWLYLATTVVFAALVALVLYDLLGKARARTSAAAESRAKAHSRSWGRLQDCARQAAAGAPWQEVVQGYELLAGVVFDAIDRAYDVGARSRPRSQLREMLVDDKGLAPELWDRLSRLLEYAEMVRFASSAGAVSEKAARSELMRWVTEGESITRILDALKVSQK